MNKFCLQFALFLLFSVCVYGGDIRIPAKGGGLYQVVIVDKGSEGARYDGITGAIIHTSPGTRILIRDIDFGNERYGRYNEFMIEYTNPMSVSDAFFDIYIEDTTVPVASIPVEQTRESEYKEASAPLNVNITGSHTIYIRWRNHSANLKTFGANALVPYASVDLVRTGSMTKYKFSVSGLKPVTGKHRLKMVWRGNNAAVANVYLDNNQLASVTKVYGEDFHIYGAIGGISIQSATPIGKIEIYSPDGLKMNEIVSSACSEFIAITAGFYLVKVIGNTNEVIVCKILVMD